MKKPTHVLAVLLAATVLSGCASPYMVDRGRDAADIFTATVGVGGGARARVGPVHAGVVPFNVGSYGLRGGTWDNDFSGITYAEQDYLLLPLSELGFASTAFNPDSNVATERGKGFCAGSRIPFVTTDVSSPRDAHTKRHPYSYYTQMEVTAGLIFTVNLGFNPGELLDFMLGWTTLDIFDDDIE